MKTNKFENIIYLDIILLIHNKQKLAVLINLFLIQKKEMIK